MSYPSIIMLKYAQVLAIWVLVFIPIIPNMYQAWLSHSNNSHGLLVPFISAFFIYQKKDKVDLRHPGSMTGCILLLISLLFYLVNLYGGIVFFTRLMIPVSLLCLIWCMLGFDNLKTILFPVSFLVFMIPVPDSVLNLVSLPLQRVATNISALIIRALSIPVYQEGNLLYFTQTQLEVAEACSGLRSIIALIMLSAILVYISDMDKIRNFLLCALAVPIALSANILRVSATGVIAHYYGDGVARSFLHDLSGIAVFVVGFLCLLFVYRILNKPAHRDS